MTNDSNMLIWEERPLTLDGFYGQDKTVQTFRKYSKNRNFPRILFFVGTTGLGKTTLAKIVGKSILCDNLDEQGFPCNSCSKCVTIIKEKISSFYFEKNGSDIGIDEVRELEDLVKRKEFGITNKVIIIEELQEVFKRSAVAANRLLRLLEYPSSDTFFIVTAMDLSKVPDALKGRLQVFYFKQFSYELISENLYRICKNKNIDIDTDIEKANVLITIADSCKGSMREAISMLQRVIDSELWTVKEVIAELDIVSNQALSESINYLLSGDIKVLDLKFTDDILKRTRYLFNLLFKNISGYNLNSYEKSQLQNIDKNVVTQESLMIVYEELNSLFAYSYQPQDLIEYHLIKIVQRIKKLTKSDSKVKLEENNSIVKRRR